MRSDEECIASGKANARICEAPEGSEKGLATKQLLKDCDEWKRNDPNKGTRKKKRTDAEFSRLIGYEAHYITNKRSAQKTHRTDANSARESRAARRVLRDEPESISDEIIEAIERSPKLQRKVQNELANQSRRRLEKRITRKNREVVEPTNEDLAHDVESNIYRAWRALASVIIIGQTVTWNDEEQNERIKTHLENIDQSREALRCFVDGEAVVDEVIEDILGSVEE